MDSSLARFWVWWSEAGPRIAAAIAARTVGALAEEISAQVRALDPGLAWELGPGRRSEHNLTLSPEGSIVLRRLTERWVRSAPMRDPTWEFYPARQPAPELQLAIAGHTLDPAEWLIAAEIDEGRLLLNLSAYHPVLRKLPDRERPRAGFIALDQMFGEDAVEKWMGQLKFTTDKPRDAATPTDVLNTMEALAEESKKEVFTLAQARDKQGHPVFLNFNERLKWLDHLFAESRVQLDLQLRQPSAHGLPTQGEGEALNLLEDQLLAASSGAVYVGRLTGNGRRTWHFYAEDPQRIVEIITGVVTASGWQQRVRTEPDPEWSFYRTGMLQDFALAA